jgi:anthranilate/para-aminobenzoate synthase component I
MGWIDDSGMMVLNVGIRTISAYDASHSASDSIDGTLEYQAGCGIVADSEPLMEYQESIDKTEVFRRTLELISHQSGCP